MNHKNALQTPPLFSKITLGMWRLNAWQMSDTACLDFIKQALELGITTIDNADIYGSQCQFGRALALQPSLRYQLQIVTKCGIILRDDKHLLRVNHYDTSRQHIINSLNNSLKEMQVDYVDTLLIHRPSPLMDADEVAEAFLHLKQAGKVRHVGVSNFTPAQFDLLASRCELVTNQVELSPLHLAPLHDGTLDSCQQRKITPMIWSALAGGRIFTDKTEPATRIRQVTALLADIYNATPTTILTAWVLQHPSKPSVLTGTGRISAIKEAVAAQKITLSQEHWFAIWSAATGTAVP